MTIWVTNTGQEIELADDFKPKPLKALGWKKKPGPKAQPPVTPQAPEEGD